MSPKGAKINSLGRQPGGQSRIVKFKHQGCVIIDANIYDFNDEHFVWDI